MRVKGQWYLNIHSIDSSRVGQRFLLAGGLLQLVVRCRGEWKVTLKDKDGPRDFCGRTICRLAAVCGDATASRRTVFRLVESSSNGRETVKKGINPGCTSSAVQRVSRICQEHRRVPIDELQLLTSLCSATCNNS